MNNLFFRIIMVLVVLGAIAGLGFFAYQAGVAQGVAQNVQLQPGDLPTLVYPYHGMGYGRPFFGFSFLSCLGPLFLFFLVFAALRGLFWHGHYGWGRHHHGPWGYGEGHEGIPSRVAEWHRKLHEAESQQAGAQPPSEQV